MNTLYQNFGTEVSFTLNPFVYGGPSASQLRCFDEATPCSLEQYSMCVVENYDQSVYVPWLVCMDSNNDPTQQCDTQTGVVDADMQTCLADNSALIAKYLQIDSPIGGTPTVSVNGDNCRTSYSAISRALCKAEPALTGCSAAVPNGADEEIEIELVPGRPIVA